MDNEPDSVIDAEAIEASKIPDSTFHLTTKQQRFIEAYKQHGDATKAAISAGYAVKSANVEGSRLLKSAKILAELKHWKHRKASEMTKHDFVDLALQDYRQLDVTEPNKPRFLDLAGKALGHLGNNVPSITNNTLNVTKIEMNSLPSPAKWDALRSIMESE